MRADFALSVDFAFERRADSADSGDVGSSACAAADDGAFAFDDSFAFDDDFDDAFEPRSSSPWRSERWRFAEATTAASFGSSASSGFAATFARRAWTRSAIGARRACSGGVRGDELGESG